MDLNGEYSIRLTITKDLCWDVVFLREFQYRHLKVTFVYGSHLPERIVKIPGALFALRATDAAGPT